MKKNANGFTVVEVLIAIVVIAIIVAIGVVVHGEIRKKAYNAAADTALHQAEKAVRSFDAMTITEQYKMLDPNTTDTYLNNIMQKLKLYDSHPVTAGGAGAPHIPKGSRGFTNVRIHWCGGSKYFLYTAAYEGITEYQLNQKLSQCKRPSTALAAAWVYFVHPDSPLFKYRELDLK